MKKYGHEKAKLMMINTDSLLYQITTDDLYRDMEDDKHLFDFSNYDTDHPLYDTSNSKTPGLFKDETGGVPIQQFVGLRSKMYWIKNGRMEQKRANGIVKPVVKKELRHTQYVDCILESKNNTCQMNVIRSHKQNLHILTINKLELCAFDDKRYVLDSSIDTLAFGHQRVCILICSFKFLIVYVWLIWIILYIKNYIWNSSVLILTHKHVFVERAIISSAIRG